MFGYLKFRVVFLYFFFGGGALKGGFCLHEISAMS